MSKSVATDAPWIEAIVRGATRASDDILILELAPTKGALPSYTPGAHIAIECGTDRVRHYSLWGPMDSPDVYQLGIKLSPESRGGSQWIKENALPGRVLRISEPRNHFPLVEARPHYLFLSGGIGITPIIPMLHALKSLDRRARLVHMCRSSKDFVFAPWLGELAEFHDIHLHYDSEAGAIFDIESELESAPSDSAVYCCGPGPMMTMVEEFGIRHGRSEHFHFEFFEAPAAAALTASSEPNDFVVIQQSTGREIPVSESQTMLQAIRDAGIKAKSECEYGVCGWCAVNVVDGTPKHLDSYLTAAERASNKVVLPCVSRCVGQRITLDI